jgi:hypothetical protein
MRRRLGIVLTTVALACAGVGVAANTTAGAAPAPSITVGPSLQLEDGQVVAILGRDFFDTPLSSGWRALQCDSGILDGPIAQQMIAHCDPNGPPGVTAVNGAFRIDFTVHRMIHVGEEGRPVTCGVTPGDCALVVASGTTTGGFVGAAESISFTGDHTVSVTPSTGLRDGQSVTVSGTGFVERVVGGGGWTVALCATSAVATPLVLQEVVNHCDLNPPYTSVVPDPDGTFSTQLTLRKTLTTSSGQVVCGQAPHDCSVLVGGVTEHGFQGATAPISFGTPVPTLRDCIRNLLADHEHRPVVKLHRLLVCIWTAVAHRLR